LQTINKAWSSSKNNLWFFFLPYLPLHFACCLQLIYSKLPVQVVRQPKVKKYWEQIRIVVIYRSTTSTSEKRFTVSVILILTFPTCIETILTCVIYNMQWAQWYETRLWGGGNGKRNLSTETWTIWVRWAIYNTRQMSPTHRL
jgi:hypothetical protein